MRLHVVSGNFDLRKGRKIKALLTSEKTIRFLNCIYSLSQIHPPSWKFNRFFIELKQQIIRLKVIERKQLWGSKFKKFWHKSFENASVLLNFVETDDEFNYVICFGSLDCHKQIPSKTCTIKFRLFRF